MKYILSFFILCQMYFIYGQKWLHDGAEWHYTATSEGLNTFHHLKLVGDTSILGESWQIVWEQRYFYQPTGPTTDTLLVGSVYEYYYRMNGDTLFCLNDTSTDIVIIFRDQASWTSLVDISDSSCVRIPKYTASEGVTNTPGEDPLTFYSVSDSLENNINILGLYSRRFGCLQGAFFPQSDCSINGIPYATSTFCLICYQDNDNYSIKKTQGECDSYLTLDTKNLTFESLQLYPNPAKDVVSISTERKIESVECFDLQGKRVVATFDYSTNKLNVQSHNQGLYQLRINFNAGQQIMIKLLIE